MENLKLISLRAQNIMGVRLAEIRPDGSPIVYVAGRNSQGKTSLLNCIPIAMAGAKDMPELPIRVGEKEGKIDLDLGDLTVHWEGNAETGKFKTVVKNKEGVRQEPPQTILNKFYKKTTFDPLAFDLMNDGTKDGNRRQAAVLKELMGLDFSSLDTERAEVYTKRTAINGQLNAIEVKLASMPTQNAPEQEVSLLSLSQEVERRLTVNRENEKKRGEVEIVNQKIKNKQVENDGLNKDLSSIETQTAHLQKQLAFTMAKIENVSKEGLALVKEKEKIEKEISGLVDLDIQPIKNEMAEAEKTNVKVRQNKTRIQNIKERDDIKAKSDSMTGRIQEIDEAKSSLLEEAKFPVPGLTFSEDGVVIDGIPWRSCSRSQRIITSAAIGAAQNPNFRVMLIRDGNVLDLDNRIALAKFAEENGILCLLEWVGEEVEGAEPTVILEGGEDKTQEIKERNRKKRGTP